MSNKSLFATLLGSAAAPAAVTPPSGAAPVAEGGATDLTADRVESALQSAKAEGVAEGAAAERARTAAVFASAEGKANMPMAAWMLGSNPAASADSIIAQLKTMPAAAAVAPAAPEVPQTPQEEMQQQLAETPLVDLNGGKPGANANDGGSGAEDPAKLWDSIQKPEGQAGVTRGGMVFGKKTGN